MQWTIAVTYDSERPRGLYGITENLRWTIRWPDDMTRDQRREWLDFVRGRLEDSTYETNEGVEAAQRAWQEFHRGTGSEVFGRGGPPNELR